MDTPTYANVPTLAAAADIAVTPAAQRGLLDHLQAATDTVTSLCGGRRFYATVETRTFDWPDPTGRGQTDRLWLDEYELADTPTSITVAGDAFTAYKLRPHGGPPWRWIEPDYEETAFFSPFSSGADGPQDAISIVGLFGYGEDLTASGALNGAVSSTTATAVPVTDTSVIGPGDAIKVDDEYMIVTGDGWSDTGENLAAALTLDSSDTAVTVADGAVYTAGERLLVDRERLEIAEIVGTTLHVDRAVDGTTIAAHSLGADIYALRALTVTRGALGTTAATHSDAAVIYRHSPPPAVTRLTVAEALVSIAQDRASWARTVGAGENTRPASGRALQSLRDDVRRQYGQRGRVTAAGGRSW
jgi:hypothetical protein